MKRDLKEMIFNLFGKSNIKKWLPYVLALFALLVGYVLRPYFEKGETGATNFIDSYERFKQDSILIEELQNQLSEERKIYYQDRRRMQENLYKSDQLINQILNDAKDIQDKRNSINLDSLDAIQRFDRITGHIKDY